MYVYIRGHIYKQLRAAYIKYISVRSVYFSKDLLHITVILHFLENLLHSSCTDFGGNCTKDLSDITSNVRTVVTFVAAES